MDEPAVRLLVVAGVALVALTWGGLSRRGAVVRRRRVTLPAFEPGLVLFTSRGCGSCARARDVLERATPDGFRELVYESDPSAFTRAGISKVPAIVRVVRDGTAWVAVGIPGEWRLRRWLRGP